MELLEYDLHGRTTVTAEVKAQMDNSPVVSPMQPGMGLTEDLQSIPQAINNSTDSYKQNTAIIKEFGNVMPEIIKNLRMMNDAVVRNTQNLPAIKKVVTDEDKKKQRNAELARQNLLGAFNTGNNMLQSYANGNTTGAVLSGMNGVTNLTNNLSKSAEMADMGGLAKGLLAAGVVGSIVSGVVKGADALTDKFIDEMPTVYGTGRAFGSTNDNFALSAWSKVNEYNKGTGLNSETFQGLVQSLRKQGVGNDLLSPQAQLDLAGNIAKTTSRWAYYTGGDANQYANLAGLMSRYGGSTNVAEDFNYLVSAGKASGLDRTQIPEFLSGIQKVMEEGIANGFTRSATDVASTLLMFSKLSNNNPFWQGEQGAKLINQANRGLASATGLSKTSDIIAYRAISQAYKGKEESELGQDLYLKDGGYVNKMMLLERGLRTDNFGKIMESIYSTTGSTTQRAELLKDMFGVNYSGASRFMNLYDKNGGTVTEEELKNILEDPDNQNKETKNQENINSIKDWVVKIGSKTAAIKIDGMGVVVDGVTRLANKLAPNELDKSPISENNGMRKVQEKKGELGEDYYKTVKDVTDKVNKEFTVGEKALFRSRTENAWDNGSGVALESSYDRVKEFNPLTWDEYGITPNKKNGNVTSYQVEDVKDLSIYGAMAEMDRTHVSDLLSQGKISNAAFSTAVENSDEFRKAFNKAKGWTGKIDFKEIGNLEKILDKIYAQLVAGVLVTEEK